MSDSHLSPHDAAHRKSTASEGDEVDALDRQARMHNSVTQLQKREGRGNRRQRDP
jgi:hypothetical protein